MKNQKQSRILPHSRTIRKEYSIQELIELGEKSNSISLADRNGNRQDQNDNASEKQDKNDKKKE